jgi:hypothetical protein
MTLKTIWNKYISFEIWEGVARRIKELAIVLETDVCAGPAERPGEGIERDNCPHTEVTVTERSSPSDDLLTH